MIKATGKRTGDKVRVDFALNRGEWFGKTWLIRIAQGFESCNVLVEADNESDAVDVLADSKRAYLIALPSDDDPDAYYAGNYGIPVDLESVSIEPCKVDYFASPVQKYAYP